MKKMTDSGAGALKKQDEPEAFCHARKKMGRETRSKVSRSHLKEFQYSQGWNNLGNKINNTELDYNPKYKINLHESMPM